MINTNILLQSLVTNTDSYKVSHFKQYKPGTTKVFSYIESRGGEFDKTLYFGLQMYLKEYLSRQVTQEEVEEAKVFMEAHGEPFNYEGWTLLVDRYKGKLPLSVRSIPEGTVLNTSNIMVSVENTDPEFFWLTSYIETSLLRAIWYPTTVATNSYDIKQTIKEYLEKTGTPESIMFKFVDFGARGVSSFESSGIGGAANLISFAATDNITGSLFAQKYYNAEGPVGFSIPASEHSTMSSWGGREGEPEAMDNMLVQFLGEGKMVACVSDTYDIFNAAKNLWGKRFKDKIIESGGTLVVRPDSGDPVDITLQLVEILAAEFGFTTNEKGYKVLNPAIRIIQGDGIDRTAVRDILESYKINGWSADNIAFGCGGGLLQKLDRDTLRFAMKASATEIDGEYIDVFKEPITDTGKKSKKGRMTLVQDDMGGYRTVRLEEVGDQVDVMREVFRNGELLIGDDFEMIRERSNY
jgi:nicotinamide phosphoribosyltransferase